MTSHFVDKERAFVDGLEGETGRSLGGWMTEIEASGLTARNDIIDWLRQRGFTFAKASWLERIHHNGGALIYAGDGVPAVPAAPSLRPPLSVAAAGHVPARSVAVPQSPAIAEARHQPGAQFTPPRRPFPPAPAVTRPPAMPKPSPVSNSAAADVGLDAILAQGKAFRPLAQALLREILATLPGADLRPADGIIVFEMPSPFCAVVPGPKGVRLDLPAGLGPSPLFQASRSAAVAGLNASALLTDARQIDETLLKAVACAARQGPDGG